MKITRPDNCLELLKQCETGKPALWGGMFPDEFYNTLRLFPEFARDAKIRAMLASALETAALRYRIRASMILLRVGDPLGILHLTYNSLSTHPLLKVSQDLAGLWPDAHLLREADHLTDECIELLINDLEQPHAFWHMDILAALPAEKIIPRMRVLLAQEGTAAIVAAYVMAMKHNDEGRSILEGLVESQKLLNLALAALSHIPNYRVLSYLRSYAAPQNPIYNRQYDNLMVTNAQRSGLMQDAHCRLFLLEHRSRQPVQRTMEAFYLDSIQEMIAQSDVRSMRGHAPRSTGSGGKVLTLEEWAEATWRWIKPTRDIGYRLFVINSGVGITSGTLMTGVNAPDFLCEFSTPEVRTHCAEIQRASIRALLKVIGWRTLEDGSDMGISTTFLSPLALPPTGRELAHRNMPLYLPGIEIKYGPKDYEHAATDWILNPGRYRTNTYWPKLMMQ